MHISACYRKARTLIERDRKQDAEKNIWNQEGGTNMRQEETA